MGLKEGDWGKMGLARVRGTEGRWVKRKGNRGKMG